MKKARALRMGSLLALAMAVLAISPLVHGNAMAETRPYYVWEVTIRGAAFSSFVRSGLLIATPTITRTGTRNGINPLDFWLVSGNPSATPEPGAIWFGTNNAFSMVIGDTAGRARLDLAYVSASGNTNPGPLRINARVDPSIARAAFFNHFTARGGLTANIYQIIEGTMNLTFQNALRNVQGQVSIIGSGYILPSRVVYNATLSGTYRGSGTWNW